MSGHEIMGWVIGSIGVLGWGVGAVTGALVLDRKAVVEDPAHCDADKFCDQVGVDAAADGETFSIVSTLSFIFGTAAVATGVILIVTAPDDDAAVGVTVAPTHEGGFLALRGRF